MSERTPPKSPRWKRYVVLATVGLVIACVIGVVAVGSYYRSLIDTYTQTHSVPLSIVDTSPEAQAQLQAKWDAFHQTIIGTKAPTQMQLSTDDLNLFLSRVATLRERVRLRIQRGELFGDFTIPLERPGRANLKGRYLNGVATLKVTFIDGLLSLNITAMQANGRPIPNWILRRVAQKNLLFEVNENPGLADVLQSLETIEVGDRLVTVKAGQAP